jgi:hypothetical protein
MKKTIQIDGNPTNDFSGYHKISDIEEYLKEMKTKGYTHIDIIYDAGYEEVDFVPYLERLETDAEYERRMSREQSNLSAIEQSEIALMNRLKEKYG